MCQIIVFWHSCSHVVASYIACPFANAPIHEDKVTTTAIVDSVCLVCKQQPGGPYWEIVEKMKQLLLTVGNLEYILDSSANQAGFLDQVARFYSRGDHSRFGQPGPQKAKYSKEDPYLKSLNLVTYMCHQGRKDYRSKPGYEIDAEIALHKRYDPTDFCHLNWDGADFHPASNNFLVASCVLDAMAPVRSTSNSQASSTTESTSTLASSNTNSRSNISHSSDNAGDYGYSGDTIEDLQPQTIEGNFGIPTPVSSQPSSIGTVQTVKASDAPDTTTTDQPIPRVDFEPTSPPDHGISDSMRQESRMPGESDGYQAHINPYPDINTDLGSVEPFQDAQGNQTSITAGEDANHYVPSYPFNSDTPDLFLPVNPYAREPEPLDMDMRSQLDPRLFGDNDFNISPSQDTLHQGLSQVEIHQLLYGRPNPLPSPLKLGNPLPNKDPSLSREAIRQTVPAQHCHSAPSSFHAPELFGNICMGQVPQVSHVPPIPHTPRPLMLSRAIPFPQVAAMPKTPEESTGPDSFNTADSGSASSSPSTEYVARKRRATASLCNTLQTNGTLRERPFISYHPAVIASSPCPMARPYTSEAESHPDLLKFGTASPSKIGKRKRPTDDNP